MLDNDTSNSSPYFQSMSDTKLKFFIREWRKKRKLTQGALADLLDTSVSKVSKLETQAQRVDEVWIAKLASALQISPADLFRSPEQLANAEVKDELAPAPIYFQQIPILGEVAAGAWLEVDPLKTEEEPTDWLPFSPDPQLNLNSAFVLKVHGTSLNKIAPEGSLLVCTPYAGQELSDGDLTIVERARDGGSLIEVTAKRVRQPNGHFELWPESNDPKWQTPIVLNGDDDGIEISIKALVKKIIIEP